MKRRRNYIRFAWIVLICFIAGQTMVFSHQHLHNIKAAVSHTSKSPQAAQTVTDTCSICDLMHHTDMAIFSNASISPTVTICETIYANTHDYKGIALILSAGRSPPAV